MRIERNWKKYYAAHQERAPRERFLDALSLFTSSDDERSRFAVDLGCGNGREALHLLETGWRVLATDAEEDAIAHLEANVSSEQRDRLETRVSTFAEIQLPKADFIHAGFSLPFCAMRHLPALWQQITNALSPGGRFTGEFFGINDTWADSPEMSFHEAAGVEALLDGWIVENFEEVEQDGNAVSGPKHWHLFHVTARRP